MGAPAKLQLNHLTKLILYEEPFLLLTSIYSHAAIHGIEPVFTPIGGLGLDTTNFLRGWTWALALGSMWDKPEVSLSLSNRLCLDTDGFGQWLPIDNTSCLIRTLLAASMSQVFRIISLSSFDLFIYLCEILHNVPLKNVLFSAPIF